MPELPEVEVTRQNIAEPLAGAEVRSVRLGAPLRWPLGCAPQALVGARVGLAARRGKYLWLPLERHGRTAGGLLIHLGMSGSLAWRASGAAAPGRHDHFDLVTSRGTLRLTDPRRFGAVLWSPAMDAPPAATLLARLGAEPLDGTLTDEAFHAALRRRRCSVKSALLAGDIVVGAGNIYACEALFAAGIDPRTRCDRLSRPRAARLLACVRTTLRRALDLGGSTLRDFRDAHGMDGAYQQQASVYGREGQPCLRCAAAVRRVVQGQRSTFFCPACQRR
ncbi:MAG TPA: bifunctional DNA-formamidopyrimidine glycosylase/DNA-(apurinic or apyrimidinic site) lyase [Burkholderiaceae bacterium]|nr:bifunctional DNA-formamidopyrimidine glycosylase/DNA-(apurinic or apyrimidinic site) lyase [Burkholderiaceae bacterium]